MTVPLSAGRRGAWRGLLRNPSPSIIRRLQHPVPPARKMPGAEHARRGTRPAQNMHRELRRQAEF